MVTRYQGAAGCGVGVDSHLTRAATILARLRDAVSVVYVSRQRWRGGPR